MSLKAYYTITEVVKECLVDLPENQSSEREYDRYLKFALSGLRRLRTTVTKDGKKYAKITPDAINHYDFPDDMEEFIALYVPVNGKMWRLTRDRGIIATKTTVGLDDSNDTDYGEGVNQPVAQLNTFTAVGGVNLEGYFTIDEENREIIINNNRKDELVVEYATLGSTSVIPTKYVEALKSWIMWKAVLRDYSVPMNTKLLYEKMYKDEVNEIKKIEGPSLQELVDSWSKKSLVR